MATPYDYYRIMNPSGSTNRGQTQSGIQNFMDQQWEKTGGGIDPALRRIIEGVQRSAASAPPMPAPAPVEPPPHVWAKPVNATTPPPNVTAPPPSAATPQQVPAPTVQTPVNLNPTPANLNPNPQPIYVSNSPEQQQLAQAQQMRLMGPSGNTAINPQTNVVQPSGAVDNMDLQALVNAAIQRLIAGGYNG